MIAFVLGILMCVVATIIIGSMLMVILNAHRHAVSNGMGDVIGAGLIFWSYG